MISSERHNKISELFLATCELPPEERAAFLEKACADDAGLRAEVEALLAADSEHSAFLGSLAGSEDARAPYPDMKPGGHPDVHRERAGMPLPSLTASPGRADPSPRISIEGYEILHELHRGGQGAVYQAIQKATKRKVAIKVLIEGPYASKSARKRFEREIELVAQLKHPNIISIFHSGVTPEGMHFYVMDYIRGLRLDQYVHDKHLSLEDTLKLFGRVCDAVQYAHQRGVIHRDLKPSNILVDSTGSPKVLDFGLAKMLAAPVETVVSITQQVIGTLPYMSPEQAAGNPDEIDTRADIYALGVILYELLTGHYPYPVAGQMVEVLKHIAETPPTPLTRSWTKDLGVTARSSKPRRVAQCPIDDELQTVVLKTLSKERERRYQSAGELAKDIQHYLADEPIEAKRDSGWYVFRKALHRHRSKAMVAAAFVVLITGFGTYLRWDSAQQAAAEARQERLRAVAEARQERLRRTDQLITDGLDLVERDWWEGAHVKFEEAVRLSPQHFKALCFAAWWRKEDYFQHKPFRYRNREVLEETNELCERAMQMENDNHALWNLKSVLLYSLGRLTEAEQACRHVMALKPNFFQAHTNLAKVLALQNKFDEALEIARRGAQTSLQVGAEGKYDDGIWRTLGTLQLYLGQAEALESLQKAIEISHRDTRTTLLLARLHLTLPEHQDILEALVEAKMADAFTSLDDPRYKRILAQAYLRNGKYDDAARSAQAAIQGGDSKAVCHLVSAIAKAELGDPAAAEEALASAKENWPEQFKNGDDVIVMAEKGLLWFDTAAELDKLRAEAEQLIQSRAAASP
ncbi:MAG: protein kinase [Phycisphaerae bacterium]